MNGCENESGQKNNRSKWHHYLTAVMFVAVGVLFVVYEKMDISVVCKVFSCVFAVVGAVSIISYCIKDVDKGYYRLDLASGIMCVFAAFLFYRGQEAVNEYFPVIAGLILVANGVIKLQHSIDMKRIDRKMKKVTEMWLVVMIFALAGITAGLITTYLTPEKERTTFILVGIALIIAGASDILTHIVFAGKIKAYKNMEKEEQEETDSESQPDVGTEPENAVPDNTAAGDDDQVLFEVETPEPSAENKDDTDKLS